jgi:hypothetical protein
MDNCNDASLDEENALVPGDLPRVPNPAGG